MPCAHPPRLPGEHSHHPPTHSCHQVPLKQPGACSSVPHRAATGLSSDSDLQKEEGLLILHSGSNTGSRNQLLWNKHQRKQRSTALEQKHKEET